MYDLTLLIYQYEIEVFLNSLFVAKINNYKKINKFTLKKNPKKKEEEFVLFVFYENINKLIFNKKLA